MGATLEFIDQLGAVKVNFNSVQSQKIAFFYSVQAVTGDNWWGFFW